MLNRTRQYVKTTWEKSVVQPADSSKPEMYVRPFVPPCVTGLFRSLFYWDTFYTNRGLLTDGFLALAKDNVDNLINAVHVYGFVPNALSDSGTKWCSQPPYLHFMIRDIYEKTGDTAWLKGAYFALKKEYAFWMRERITETGLNRHYHLPLDEKSLVEYYDYVARERLRIPTDIPDCEKAKRADHYVAVAESGLDWSPRFRASGANVIPIDLNANLYAMERDLAEWAVLFEPSERAVFRRAMELRKERLDKYCLGEDGLYHDYDFVSGKQNRFSFTGQFFPFIVGLSRDSKAALRLLSAVEAVHGIVSTEKDEEETGISYQWSYPNSWAPDNYLAVWALELLGLDADAARVAKKYMENVAGAYEKTGLLWEKYDGVKGGVAVKTEHAMTEMLGWTGGVYSCFHEKYNQSNR